MITIGSEGTTRFNMSVLKTLMFWKNYFLFWDIRAT